MTYTPLNISNGPISGDSSQHDQFAGSILTSGSVNYLCDTELKSFKSKALRNRKHSISQFFGFLTIFSESKYFRRRKWMLYFLLFVFIASITLLFVGTILVGFTNHRSLFRLARKFMDIPRSKGGSMPEVWDRFTEIECNDRTHSCRITNLYMIGGELHAYIGEDEVLELSLTDVVVYTGIGFGSPIIKFQRPGHLAFPPEESSNVTSQGELSNLDANTPILEGVRNAGALGPTVWKLPIYVHYEDPPSVLPSGVRFHTQPTIFYSIMWENLFRTMYAGAGSWFTMMEWGVDNVEEAKMVLIDLEKPKAFLHLLQSVTPFPLKWFEDQENAVFEVAIVGISRELGIPEITVEKKLQPHDIMRDKAFRAFCSKVKNRILDNYHGLSHQEALRGDANIPISSEGDLFSVMHQKQDTAKANVEVSNLPRVTLVLREGNTRKILNQDALIEHLRGLPIQLGVHRFGNMSIKSQVEIIDSSDLLIAMHGAALTHVLFLRPGALVVELFPYVFKKTIYQNLARIMGLKYMHWQNTNLNKTVFDWSYVETHRFTNREKELIVDRPIDWYNMDSKNYWRNQDTFIELSEFMHIIRTAVDAAHEPGIKYMLYQPWGYFAEQLNGLKSACAAANILGRTLVLAPVGSKSAAPPNDDDEERFKTSHYKWKPISNYFDMGQLAQLPCQVITFENFFSINRNQTLGDVKYFSDPYITTPHIDLNVNKYYSKVVDIPFSHVFRDTLAHQRLHMRSVQIRFGHRHSNLHNKEPVNLALGPLFPYYDFSPLLNRTQRIMRPNDHYTLLNLKVPLYLEIIQHLQFRPDIVKLAKVAFWKKVALDEGLDEPSNDLGEIQTQLARHSHQHKILAIHIRRGDFAAKCQLHSERFTGTSTLKSSFWNTFGYSKSPSRSCYQDTSYVADKIHSIMDLMRKSGNERLVVYIITDKMGKGEDQDERVELRMRLQVGFYGGEGYRGFSHEDLTMYFLNDLIDVDKVALGWNYQSLDQVELAMVEMTIATEADIFLGNKHSTFSREVAERRYIKKRKYYFF